MAENQLNQVKETTWDMVNSYRESSQAIADSLITLQERNLKFAQSIFLNWMELLTQQTQSMQQSQQQWGQQTRKHQEALQKLASTSMQMYVDFLLAPFSFSRRLIEASETAMRREPALVP